MTAFLSNNHFSAAHSYACTETYVIFFTETNKTDIQLIHC